MRTFPRNAAGLVILLSLQPVDSALAAQVATPSPTSSATTAPYQTLPSSSLPKFDRQKEDPAITARVRAEFLARQIGIIDRSHYSAKANAAVTDAAIAKDAPALQQLGAVRTVALFVKGKSDQGDTVYLYELMCEHGAVHVIFGLDADDKISMFGIKPS